MPVPKQRIADDVWDRLLQLDHWISAVTICCAHDHEAGSELRLAQLIVNAADGVSDIPIFTNLPNDRCAVAVNVHRIVKREDVLIGLVCGADDADGREVSADNRARILIDPPNSNTENRGSANRRPDIELTLTADTKANLEITTPELQFWSAQNEAGLTT
jgi:hypothetical protein